jgi:3-methyladenine DNA glycosylase AlkD
VAGHAGEVRPGGSPRDVLARLRALADPDALKSAARNGIPVDRAYGVSMPRLRALARELGVDHGLALALWGSGVHEARILAGLVDDAAQVDDAQMERWAAEFDAWDVCDQVCTNLFRHSALAYEKAVEWMGRAEPLVKRAGMVLVAVQAVHDKGASDERFAALVPLVVAAADDERPLVRKGACWALRQIGKRNRQLNALAIDAAERLRGARGPGARWVGADALRELRSPRLQARLEGG